MSLNGNGATEVVIRLDFAGVCDLSCISRQGTTSSTSCTLGDDVIQDGAKNTLYSSPHTRQVVMARDLQRDWSKLPQVRIASVIAAGCIARDGGVHSDAASDIAVVPGKKRIPLNTEHCRTLLCTKRYCLECENRGINTTNSSPKW